MECPAVVQLGSIRAGQVLARTPSHPGARCTCATADAKAVVYRLTIEFTTVGNQSFHMNVAAPWHAGYDVSCVVGDEPTEHCWSSGDSFHVWTTDPNAPAINIVAEPNVCF